MNLRFRLLSRRRRNEVRKIARECYMASIVDAEEEAERRLRATYSGILSMILVGLAVRLAVELIKYWFLQNTTQPPLMFVQGEPGADE